MLQNQQLKVNAPDSLFLRYIPQDTGSPGYDFNTFAEQHGNRPLSADDLGVGVRSSAWRHSGEKKLYSGNASRIDLEDTFIIGDGVIVRIEPDIASMDEREMEAKIASVLYATKVLGNSADAVEFVRCVRALAGEDARGLDLQIIASHYYGEARRRPISEVLKEMALLAMELSAVTTTNDERQFGETVETEIERYNEPLTVSDRRALSWARAAEVLGEVEVTARQLFDAEIRERSRYLQAGNTQGFEYDDEARFYAFAKDQAGDDAEMLEALMDSFVHVHEQYDEGNVVSLHMSDGERVVVLGTLAEDVSADYLPTEARHLAGELRQAYTGGAGAQKARKLMADAALRRAIIAVKRKFRSAGKEAVEKALSEIPAVGGVESFSRRPLSESELERWIECATSEIYNRRVKRTARRAFVPTDSQRHNRLGRPVMFTTPFMITVNADAETKSFVEQVLETLLEQMKADFHLRGQRYNPLYKNYHRLIRTARDTALVSSTIKEAFKAKEEGTLSLGLFTALNTAAKLQRWALEGERVSPACNCLLAEIQKASKQKLMFLRWAIYGDNQPNHPIHSLPRQEKARVWDALKAATNLPTPLAA